MPVGRQKVDIGAAMMNALNMYAQMRGQRMQGQQFGQQMGQQQAQFEAQAQATRERELMRHKEWKEEFKLEKEAKKAEIDRLNAVIETINLEKELTAQKAEVRTIMSAELGLKGETAYQTPEQWAEHPGIREAGLGGVLLQMGEEIKGQVPDYGEMMEAINYSIATGATLPPHLTQAQGYVDRQRELTTLLETNAITKAEYELQSMKAESEWNAFRAANPWAFVPRYGTGGLGATIPTPPPAPPGTDAASQISYLQQTQNIDPRTAAEQVYSDIVASFSTREELYNYLRETWGLELGEGFAYSPEGLKEYVISAILARAGVTQEPVKTVPQYQPSEVVEPPPGAAFRGRPGREV